MNSIQTREVICKLSCLIIDFSYNFSFMGDLNDTSRLWNSDLNDVAGKATNG